jgi:hypothetical protein
VEVNLVYKNQNGKQHRTLNTSDHVVPELEGLSRLRRLYLDFRQISDEKMPYIARLRELEEFVAWDAVRLSDKGVAHLACLDRLSSIHISNSRIGDESLRIFSQLPRIERLSLQGNHFTDRGLKYLRGMKQLKSLWLGDGHGQITDVGAAELLHLKSLEEIDLQDYPISREMEERLRRLPNLKGSLFAGCFYVRIVPSWVPFPFIGRSVPVATTRLRTTNTRLPPLSFPDFERESTRIRPQVDASN